MGGYGSGLYGNGGGKVAVEQCRSIDIRRWQRDNLLSRPSFVWSWFNDRGKTKASIGVLLAEDYLTLFYKVGQEQIEINILYDETVTGFGARKWFCCPACFCRCAVLYLKGKYFACRKCHDLNYRSSQLSGDIGYYHRQLEKLCEKLKAEYEPSSYFPPFKPKNMHWNTYGRLAKRYRSLVEKRDQLFIARAKRIVNKGY